LNELFSLVEKLNDKIESTVTDEQIELIKALFKKLDKNNDNKLSREEFFSMLKEDRVMLRKKHIKCFVSMSESRCIFDLFYSFGIKILVFCCFT
jgi:Ca2+-binding EF-hand superfamily protein